MKSNLQAVLPILGFGASSVKGVGDPEGGFLHRLSILLGSADAPHPTFNFGIGGNTTRDMVKRLDEPVSKFPADVLILLGCNDVPRDGDSKPQNRTELVEYKNNLHKIFEVFRTQRVLFITSFRVQPKTGVRNEVLSEYMSAAKSLAEEFRFLIWDVFTESENWDARLWAPDGLHLGPEGHDLLARGCERRLATRIS